jgi:hypothetical protein
MQVAAGCLYASYCFESPVCASLKDYRRHECAASKERILDLNKILEELKTERTRLDRAIAALEEPASPRMVAKKASAAAQQPAASNGNKGGGMTRESRKRLSLAMKKSWAERRKQSS